MKLLITGGGGMLASDLADYYSTKKAVEIIAPTHAQLDVLDTRQVREMVAQTKPDVIVHTAAYHVNDCEDNPQMAYRLNAWAVQQLGKIAQEYHATLVYISTCGLFGDEIRPYSEYDPVHIKTEYAKSKYAGEGLAKQFCDRLFIIRPGWLFGGSIAHKKNFVYQRYLEAQAKPMLQSAGDKYGSPTYTFDLAEKIDQLLETKNYGLYHVTNQGGVSRAGYIQKIIEACGLSCRVEPVDSSHFPRKANVPDCEILHNWNLTYAGLSLLPSWEEAIERYVKKIL